ncbi:MAG TPA: NAD+ synthase [Bdellovibrionota bacterium]|nr:NAD+ synthase [Bdellovibrionota bacterium]
MKLAIAQINPTVGDFPKNQQKIEKQIQAAKARGADLILFSEQAIGGYPARDLVENKTFVRRNEEVLKSLAPLSKDITIVVGLVTSNPELAGHRVQNSVGILQDGKVLTIYTKRLLPTYDIFDESRYFHPGRNPLVIKHQGIKVGISICEDIWNPDEFWDRPRYEHDPIQELMGLNPDLILNASASPYSLGHDTMRMNLVQLHAKRHRVPVALCNQVGANDDLIFDGQSFVVNKNGEIIAKGAAFEEDLLIVDPFSEAVQLVSTSISDNDAVHKALILGIRDYAQKCGFEDALIGLSGGIDSSLAACLAVEALGPEHLKGVLMPSQFSSESSVTDALELAKRLKIKTEQIPITEIYETFLKDLKPSFKDLPFNSAEENIQARIRGNLLMALSNKFKALVISTGNKSEIAVGYCTLYGDLGGGLAAISDVPKTMVYALARKIAEETKWIPEQIFTKPPSAELRPNQTDQDSLPPYDILDGVLKRLIEEGQSLEEIVRGGFGREIAEKIITLVDRAEYKRRQAPVGLRVTSKAFGSGRRMPIAHRFRE